MTRNNRIHHWLWALVLTIPLTTFAVAPVKSMVIFGDSLSDTGNTTHLLKSLRREESPAYIVAPFKAFVLNKMTDYANDYYVPQLVLDKGLQLVNHFFDYELAPCLVDLIARIRLVPLLPGKPYWNNRFSNGRVWNEYLAQMWSIQKSDEEFYINKAFGGSWAATYDKQLTVWNLFRHPILTLKTLVVGKLVPPSLGLTVQAYLLEQRSLNPEQVYFIFSGGNDYLNILLFEDNYNPAFMSFYVDNVLNNLHSAITKLADAGAQRFVIMGLPQVAETPKFSDPREKQALNQAIEQHNERLKARIDGLKSTYPKANFLFIDIQDYLSKALNNPAQFGFTNVTEACIDVKFPMLRNTRHSPFKNNSVLLYAQALQSLGKERATYSICDNPDEYLFWDEIHPSTRAHHYLAIEICKTMQSNGYEVRCENPDAV